MIQRLKFTFYSSSSSDKNSTSKIGGTSTIQNRFIANISTLKRFQWITDWKKKPFHSLFMLAKVKPKTNKKRISTREKKKHIFVIKSYSKSIQFCYLPIFDNSIQMIGRFISNKFFFLFSNCQTGIILPHQN